MTAALITLAATGWAGFFIVQRGYTDLAKENRALKFLLCVKAENKATAAWFRSETPIGDELMARRFKRQLDEGRQG